jgi:hypothetical protein
MRTRPGNRWFQSLLSLLNTRAFRRSFDRPTLGSASADIRQQSALTQMVFKSSGVKGTFAALFSF